jgi:hypothetical protein
MKLGKHVDNISNWEGLHKRADGIGPDAKSAREIRMKIQSNQLLTGPPKATKAYSSEELKEMGMMGIYENPNLI